MNRIIAIFLSILLISFACKGQKTKELSAEDWQKDFDRLEDLIETKHIAPYRHSAKGLFEQKFTEIREYLDTSLRPLDHWIMVRYVFEVIALMRDKHTYVSDRYDYFSLLPLNMYWYDDELRIYSTEENLKDILGARVIAINSKPIQQVYEDFKKVVPYSNELGYKDGMVYYLRNPELLYGLGIINTISSVTFDVEIADGQIVSKTITPIGLKKYRAVPFINATDSVKLTPLFAKNSSKNYWFEYMPEEGLLYLRYRSAANHKGEKATAFWQRFFDFADSSSVKKLVIDVRGNSGGMPDLAYPLVVGIKKRPSLNVFGKLFTIADRGTQSAGITLTALLESMTNTVIVGEGVGDRPNHLSDARIWKLPKSKLKIALPILSYLNTHEYDIRWNIAPHVRISRSFEDYKNRHDPYLEIIRSYGVIKSSNEVQEFLPAVTGRYQFSVDKTLTIALSKESGGLTAKLSNQWETPLMTNDQEHFFTKIKGTQFSYSNDSLHMIIDGRKVGSFSKMAENEFSPLELINKGNLEEASEAYLKLRSEQEEPLGLQRVNLSSYAMIHYLLTNDFRRSEALMKINLKLHQGKGFVNISYGKLLQAHGKGFKAFLCYATGILKGYKD